MTEESYHSARPPPPPPLAARFGGDAGARRLGDSGSTERAVTWLLDMSYTATLHLPEARRPTHGESDRWAAWQLCIRCTSVHVHMRASERLQTSVIMHDGVTGHESSEQ